jgi:hypothetical protein
MHHVAFGDLGCAPLLLVLGAVMATLTPTEFMLTRFGEVAAERDRARDIAVSLEQALTEAHEIIELVRAETDDLMRESDKSGEVKSARAAATLIAQHLPERGQQRPAHHELAGLGQRRP